MSRRRLRAAINVIGGDAKLRDEEGNIRMFAFLKDTVDNWVEQKRVIEQKFLGATIFEYGCVKIESLTFPKNNLSFPVIRVTWRDCIELHNDTMTSQPPGSSKTPFQIFCVGFVVTLGLGLALFVWISWGCPLWNRRQSNRSLLGSQQKRKRKKKNQKKKKAIDKESITQVVHELNLGAILKRSEEKQLKSAITELNQYLPEEGIWEVQKDADGNPRISRDGHQLSPDASLKFAYVVSSCLYETNQ